MKRLFIALLLIASLPVFSQTVKKLAAGTKTFIGLKASLEVALKDTSIQKVLALELYNDSSYVLRISGNKDTLTINPQHLKFIKLGEGGKVLSTQGLQEPLIVLNQQVYAALIQALQTSQSPALTVTQLIAFLEEQLKAQAPPPPKN